MRGGQGFRRILLIRRKALGDALVTMPAVLAVARAWPQATIDLIVDRPFAELVAGLSQGIRVLAWPPPAGESWWRRLRQGRYDLVIDWLSNPRTAVWTVATGAPVRVGYDLPRRSWAYNVKVPRNRQDGWPVREFAGEAFLDPLRAMGLAPAPWRDGFAAGVKVAPASVRPAVATWADKWLARPGQPVALTMSATWPAKMWPAARVRELLAELAAGGVNPVLVPGPGDQWLIDALAPGNSELSVAPPTTLPELAYILEHSCLLVGTDCGPRHLAAALGRPTLTIFGPTDPAGWNPPSPRHVSLRNPVPCAPCDLTECPVAGHPCLDGLTSGTVVAAVRSMLATIAQGV